MVTHRSHHRPSAPTPPPSPPLFRALVTVPSSASHGSPVCSSLLSCPRDALSRHNFVCRCTFNLDKRVLSSAAPGPSGPPHNLPSVELRSAHSCQNSPEHGRGGASGARLKPWRWRSHGPLCGRPSAAVHRGLVSLGPQRENIFSSAVRSRPVQTEILFYLLRGWMFPALPVVSRPTGSEAVRDEMDDCKASLRAAGLVV